MHLIDLIETQLVSNRLPLVAVSVAAVPHANTPVVLTLHWHGFVEVKLAEQDGAAPVAYQPVPSSALQVNERWDRFDDLDNALLEAAWELGAWDLARRDARAFQRPGADSGEALDCLNAFGSLPTQIEGSAPYVAEVPDGEELLDCAARAGYHQWTFRPVHGGLWADTADDITLEPGGYRNPPCPVLSAPPKRIRNDRVVYQFGRCASIMI
ncbi:MAG: diguanylate cyclase [Burkholderiales bacterium]|nr:diguanylate cyclase [Burkholderiales bacterium]